MALYPKTETLLFRQIRLKRSVFFAVFGGVREKIGMKKGGDFRTILEPLRLLFSSVWPSSRNHCFCRLKTKTCFSEPLGAVFFVGLFGTPQPDLRHRIVKCLVS